MTTSSTPGARPTPAAVVVLGGSTGRERGAPDPLRDVARASRSPLVVAADSGLERAVAAGLFVHHTVGDFDSVDPSALDTAIAAGTKAHRHHPDKDATDSELAFDLAGRLLPAAAEVWVVGSTGGRFDHVLADVLAVTGPALAAFDVTAFLGHTVATVVRAGRERAVRGEVGDQVSLIPVHGPARGVSTQGLRWALVDATLAAGTTRGVSNELSTAEAVVAVDHGVLAVLQPGTRSEVDRRPTRYDPTPR